MTIINKYVPIEKDIFSDRTEPSIAKIYLSSEIRNAVYFNLGIIHKIVNYASNKGKKQ